MGRTSFTKQSMELSKKFFESINEPFFKGIEPKHVRDQIEKRFGVKAVSNRSLNDFIVMHLSSRFSGPRAYRKEFKPLTMAKHPRLDDINSAQPPMRITMGGIGNGTEFLHAYGRGK